MKRLLGWIFAMMLNNPCHMRKIFLKMGLPRPLCGFIFLLHCEISIYKLTMVNGHRKTYKRRMRMNRSITCFKRKSIAQEEYISSNSKLKKPSLAQDSNPACSSKCCHSSACATTYALTLWNLEAQMPELTQGSVFSDDPILICWLSQGTKKVWPDC